MFLKAAMKSYNGNLFLSEVTLRAFSSTRGSLYNDGGVLNVDKSTVTQAVRGIYNAGGSATIDHTSLTNNTELGFLNFGVSDTATGIALIQNSTISGNGTTTEPPQVQQLREESSMASVLL